MGVSPIKKEAREGRAGRKYVSGDKKKGTKIRGQKPEGEKALNSKDVLGCATSHKLMYRLSLTNRATDAKKVSINDTKDKGQGPREGG